jgi:multiple sugar transport system permease protein
LYEAAKIDGSGAWTTFRRITIPLISPILLYNLVICLITTFQYFTQAYTLTSGRGDPNNSTLFINLDLFREAFVFSRMGYGAAIAWLLFALVLILTMVLFVFARGRVYYAGSDR